MKCDVMIGGGTRAPEMAGPRSRMTKLFAAVTSSIVPSSFDDFEESKDGRAATRAWLID